MLLIVSIEFVPVRSAISFKSYMEKDVPDFDPDLQLCSADTLDPDSFRTYIVVRFLSPHFGFQEDTGT